MSPYGEFESNLYEYENPDLEFEQPRARRLPGGVFARGGATTPLGCRFPQFPDPPTVPKRDLTESRVFCRSEKDAHKTLQEVVKNAVKMLDETIEQLMSARDAACRGEPLNSLGLSAVAACWLKYKLSVCIDDRSVWTDPSTSRDAKKKTVAEVIRRLMRPRDELAHNQITFVCETTCDRPGIVAFVFVTDAAGKCLPGTPRPIIHLCPLFWNKKMEPYREQAIIHETVHLTHCAGEGEDTANGHTIGTPTCVAQFVAATNGTKLNPTSGTKLDPSDRPCGESSTCGAIPNDLPARCGAELGDPSF